MDDQHKKQNEKVISLANDYSVLFKSEAGERVLADLRKSFYDRRCHVKGDSHETAFREGQRDTVHKIIRFLDIANDPDQLERQVRKQ